MNRSWVTSAPTGLRYPTALAVQSSTGQLWTVVNEPGEIGPDLRADLRDYSGNPTTEVDVQSRDQA
ncbi:MAG: hypothetical protein ACREFT_01750 [Acetobacteraceae bacterium]